MKRIGFAIFAWFFLWAGCREAVPPLSSGLIEKIEITCPQTVPEARCFTDESGMKAILNYLRGADLSPPDGQLPLGYRLYTLTLTHRDGGKTVYEQIDDSWLRKNGGPWRRLDAAQGQKLPRLYLSLPDS